MQANFEAGVLRDSLCYFLLVSQCLILSELAGSSLCRSLKVQRHRYFSADAWEILYKLLVCAQGQPFHVPGDLPLVGVWAEITQWQPLTCAHCRGPLWGPGEPLPAGGDREEQFLAYVD